MNKLSLRPQNTDQIHLKKMRKHAVKKAKLAKQKRVQEYNKNPRICANPACIISIEYDRKNEKLYCSRSCAAKINNKLRSKESRKKQQLTLLNTLGLDVSTSTDFKRYRRRCLFDFNIYKEHTRILNGNLMLETRVYNPIKSKSGWTRDHMFSILDGFKCNIEPEIIKHPANCQLLLNHINSQKGHSSCITIEELKKRIKNW